MQTSLGSLQLQKACGAERGRGTCKPGMSRELRKDEKAGTGGRGALPNSGGMCKPGFAKYKSGDLKGRRGEAIQSSWEGVKPQRDEEISAGGACTHRTLQREVMSTWTPYKWAWNPGTVGRGGKGELCRERVGGPPQSQAQAQAGERAEGPKHHARGTGPVYAVPHLPCPAP